MMEWRPKLKSVQTRGNLPWYTDDDNLDSIARSLERIANALEALSTNHQGET